MEQKQKLMKPSQSPDFLSDEKIEALFYSKNPADWRLACLFIAEKYKAYTKINEILEVMCRNYGVKKTVGRLGGEPTTYDNYVYIFAIEEHFLQIIIGSYGIWCKSLGQRPLQNFNTVIEYL